MEIKICNHPFWECGIGMVLDNAYDPFYKSAQYKFYKQNSIRYIRCQDNDLRNLDGFEDVEYLTLPVEAEHFEILSSMKQLHGIEIISSQLHQISPDIQNRLEAISLHYISAFDISIADWKHLRKVGLYGFPYRDLLALKGLNLDVLSIQNCNQLATLQGLEQIPTLKILKINGCSKLQAIDAISQLCNLDTLQITECNRVQINSITQYPPQLKSFTLAGTLSNNCRLESLNFLSSIPTLKSFMTNWRIIDGDLTPLLLLEDANILRFYRNYNLTDADLPHQNVMIKGKEGVYQEYPLNDLPDGKKDITIQWFDC